MVANFTFDELFSIIIKLTKFKFLDEIDISI